MCSVRTWARLTRAKLWWLDDWVRASRELQRVWGHADSSCTSNASINRISLANYKTWLTTAKWCTLPTVHTFWHSAVAPFTLPLGCEDPAPILHLLLCVNVSEVRSGTDKPLEVVSEVQYWWTEPVWLEKPAARIKGALIRWSDNCTGPSLNKIKRNFPQNFRWPNKCNEVTVTVFANLYEEKILQLHMEKWLSSCLSKKRSLSPAKKL